MARAVLYLYDRVSVEAFDLYVYSGCWLCCIKNLMSAYYYIANHI